MFRSAYDGAVPMSISLIPEGFRPKYIFTKNHKNRKTSNPNGDHERALRLRLRLWHHALARRSGCGCGCAEHNAYLRPEFAENVLFDPVCSSVAV